MTVGKLIDLLNTFDKESEVLVECRCTEGLTAHEDIEFYEDGTKVLHIDL